jgi:hypothetical protein
MSSKLRALKELAKTGNAELKSGEIERMIENYSTAYLLGYVYGRTHIDQMFDPPEMPVRSEEDEDVLGYIEGWCDAQYNNTEEEYGIDEAEKMAHRFTSQHCDYLDILRYYRGD